MNLLTSKDLDWFETEINGRKVYILSFDIDHDLYLVDNNVYKCNKRLNELTLEFENENLDDLLNDIEVYCKKNGVKSFWSPLMDWKGYKLSPKQKELAKKLNVDFKYSWDLHCYISKMNAYKVLKEVL